MHRKESPGFDLVDDHDHGICSPQVTTRDPVHLSIRIRGTAHQGWTHGPNGGIIANTTEGDAMTGTEQGSGSGTQPSEPCRCRTCRTIARRCGTQSRVTCRSRPRADFCDDNAAAPRRAGGARGCPAAPHLVADERDVRCPGAGAPGVRPGARRTRAHFRCPTPRSSFLAAAGLRESGPQARHPWRRACGGRSSSLSCGSPDPRSPSFPRRIAGSATWTLLEQVRVPRVAPRPGGMG